MARPKTKTVAQATNDFARRHYDTILIKARKGAKETLKRLANERGVTMSRYILEAVEQQSGEKLTLGDPIPWIGKK